MRRSALLGPLLLATLVGCSLPLAGEPTPFPVEIEPSPTQRLSTPEALPTTPAPQGQINPQSVGGLHMVGEFGQDLAGQLAWSPDSRLLALSTVRGSGIFQLQGLQELRPLLSQVTPNSLAFSPDGATLVTGGRDIPESQQDTVTIWQVDDGSRLQSMIGHSDWINSVAYSPTGELVASGSDDGTARLWRVEQGTEALVLRGHRAPVTSVAFSPDGQLLATGSLDGELRLWRVSDGMQLLLLPQADLGVTCVAFSPDGITLAAGSADGVIRLFAAGTGTPLVSLSGHQGAVTDLDFSPDGSLLASSGDDNSVRFWQISSSIQLSVLAAHNAPVLSLGFSPDGQYLATASLDGSVRIWGEGEQLAAAPTPEPAVNPIQHLAAGESLALDRIQMISANSGWAIGGTGGEPVHVLRSEDGGESWRDLTPPQSAQPFEGYQLAAAGLFRSADLGWVVYYPVDFAAGPEDRQVFQIWRTADGGASWTTTRPQLAVDLNEGPPMLAFADDQFGWIMAEYHIGLGQHGFALLRTRDGGLSWQTLVQPPEGQSDCHHTGLAFGDSDTGWITQDCPNAGGASLLTTADGGQSLTPVSLPAPDSAPGALQQGDCQTHSPQLFDARRGVLAVECAGESGGYLYRTEDNGNRWTTSAYPGGELQFLDDQVGWALSRQIYKTLDGGQSWSLVKTVSWQGRFSFADVDHGWALALGQHGRVLVRTTDGAARWSVLEPTVAP